MNKQNKNKGFMLIELVVVVAIMAVMIGLGSYSLSMIASTNAKECTQELNLALVSTRTKSYSSDSATKEPVSLQVYKKNDGIYIKKSFETEEKKIGGAKVRVYYKLSSETSYTELVSANEGEAKTLEFSFNRSSGAFRPVKLDGTTAGACQSMQIISGNKVYTITCHQKTGKITVE